MSALFRPGFRLSKIDMLALLLGSVAAYGCWPQAAWFSGIILFTLGHFFLFCNVLRMARRYELIWTGTFLLLAGSTLLWGQPGWIPTYVGSLCATVLLALRQLRHPAYHGIAWQRINPNLPQWWQAQQAIKQENKAD